MMKSLFHAFGHPFAGTGGQEACGSVHEGAFSDIWSDDTRGAAIAASSVKPALGRIAGDVVGREGMPPFLAMRIETGERFDSVHEDLGRSKPSLSLHVGLASEKGPRQGNDDYCAISWQSDFFAVSDGIGGAPYGDVMSRIACEAAIEEYDASGDIEEAFAFANEQASRVSRYLGERSGATLLLAELVGDTMRFLYAGDTMAYRLRDGDLVPAMVPGRVPGGGNALDNALGYGETEPSRASMDARPDDWFLLCTDGVWEYVDEGELVRLLSDGGNAPLVAEAICRRAAKDGSDNATCVCVCVGEWDEPFISQPAAPIGSSMTPLMTPTLHCAREVVDDCGE